MSRQPIRFLSFYHRDDGDSADAMLRAFAIHHRSRPLDLLTMAGGDARMLGVMAAVAGKYGLSNYVRFESGASEERLVEFARSVDVLVMQDPTEAALHTLLSTGKPVVVCKNGLIPADVAVHAASDPKSLAAVMVSLAGDAALRATVGQHGQKFAMEHRINPQLVESKASAVDRVFDVLRQHRPRHP